MVPSFCYDYINYLTDVELDSMLLLYQLILYDCLIKRYILAIVHFWIWSKYNDNFRYDTVPSVWYVIF